MGGECVYVSVFNVESGSLQITCHSLYMVVLPTGLSSAWPCEWHMEASNFYLPETHSESQGEPLKVSRMRCSLSPRHI